MDCYQLLCELTAIKRHKLSDEARKKLQAAGVIKPESEYLQGIERGSDNIIKKHNVKVHTGKLAKELTNDFGGASAMLGPFGGKHVLLNPDSPILKNSRDAAQARRHELDELIIGGKNAKKYGNKGTTQVRKNGKLVGTHTSPRVIKREFERQKQIHNLYGSDKQSILPRVRKMTGEYQAVKNMTPKQIRKMERTASKESPTIVDKWKHMRKARKLKNPKLDFKAGAQWETSKKAIKSTVNKKPIAAKTVKTIAKKLTPKNAAHIKKFVKSLLK